MALAAGTVGRSVTLIAVVLAVAGCGASASPADAGGRDVVAGDVVVRDGVARDVADIGVAADVPGDVVSDIPANDGNCDADGDGHRAIRCGGDDCDDNDAHRYPGNAEVCLFDTGTMMRVDPTHDEDCDPSTFSNPMTHDGDHDGDTYVDLACCNGPNCGNDCADTAPVAAVPASLATSVQPQNIHPTAGEICNGVDDNCNGVIDEGDPGGGGTCANPLTEVCGSATLHCVMGSLTCDPNTTAPPLACCSGYADCDAVVTNGCEVNVGSDASHCGTCGTVCPGGAGTPACISGSCGYGRCSEGRTACGIQCVALTTDANNCGDCSHACPPVTGGAPACIAGVCGGTCAAGEAYYSGACVPTPPPRQIAPLSTATVTSQTPVFRWALAPGDDGAHVDICRNRDCSTVVTTFTATGSSGSPSTALSSGVYYWRLRGRAGGSDSLATSAVWEFWVGARTAAINTSWGTTLDVNGDGYADVVIGADRARSNSGIAYVYLGGATGLATTPARVLNGPVAGGYFGASVASAGDFNGDGYADVLVGAYGVHADTGSAYVYLGSATGVATTPVTVLNGPVAGGYFGASVASAGDVNGDGYADVVVGAYGVSGSTGSAYVYLGSATGLATPPSPTLYAPVAGGYFGASVASAGDVNGDGFADVVIGAFNLGRAYLYMGGATGLAATPGTTLNGPTSEAFGVSVANAGDVNGDGYADVVIADTSTSGSAYLYIGSAIGPATTATTTLSGMGCLTVFGTSVASAGDVNGDGYADVVISDFESAYVYLGRATGLATTPATMLRVYYSVPSSVASAGDVNGDGYADVVVGANNVGLNTGSAWVYLGSVTGIGTTPATTLNGPLSGGNFGVSVASAATLSQDRCAYANAAGRGTGSVMRGPRRRRDAPCDTLRRPPRRPSTVPCWAPGSATRS